MTSMGFMAASFVRISWIWIQVSANGETFEGNMKLTWNEAHKHCQSIGKVLFDVKKNKSESILMNILNDTNQTWIAATVELSDFFKMPVCMETTNLPSNVNKTFATDIISNCLKFCKEFVFIALKDSDCFCVNVTKKLTHSKACNSTCNNDPINPCGGNTSLSFYEKVNTQISQTIAPGFKDCVYAKNTGSVTELFTASCVGTMAEGGMCEIDKYHGNASECTSHELKLVGSDLCRMDLVSSYRWKETKELCARIGGQLVSPSKLPLSLEEKRTYWLGIHRVTKIHEAKVEQNFLMNDTYCAVARKEGEILLIEGEDCQAMHAILCQDEDIMESKASSSTPSSETPRKGSNSEHADGTIIYLVVAVSAIFLVATVITALACVFSKRHSSQKTDVSDTNSSTEHHVMLHKQSTNPPAKPLRKEHSKKEHVQISYQNIVPVCNEQDVEMQQPGHSNTVEKDYDKIELDKEHRQENDNKEDGQHIYEHTFPCTTEDQYDLTDLSGYRNPNPDDTYHTTTLTQNLEKTKLVDGEDCKVNFETYKEDDNDFYATMGKN